MINKRVKTVESINDLSNVKLFMPGVLYVKDINKHICVQPLNNYDSVNPVLTTITYEDIHNHLLDTNQLSYEIISTFDTGTYDEDVVFEK